MGLRDIMKVERLLKTYLRKREVYFKISFDKIQ